MHQKNIIILENIRSAYNADRGKRMGTADREGLDKDFEREVWSRAEEEIA